MTLVEPDGDSIKIVRKLYKSLSQLGFKYITVDKLTEYPSPNPISLPDRTKFTPFLSALKNDYDYIFEVMTDHLSDPALPAKFDHLLKQVEILDQTEFVLVVPYGQKNVYERWVKKHNLPLPEIWEIVIY